MTLPYETSIGQSLAHLKRIAPQGFAVGLHIRFIAPILMFNAYPKEWIESYSRQGFLPKDPTVRWGMTHQGVLPWDQVGPDPDGVMSQAAAHGLKYGISYALEDGTRSTGGFARADRPFSETEIAEIRSHFDRLHGLTRGIETLSPNIRAKLRDLSISVQES